MSYAAPQFHPLCGKACALKPTNHAHSQPDVHRPTFARIRGVPYGTLEQGHVRLPRGNYLGTIVGASLGIDATIVHAQSFPTRPVKTTTDVGVGGTYDISARALGEELHKKWGEPVIVEPHPEATASSAPALVLKRRRMGRRSASCQLSRLSRTNSFSRNYRIPRIRSTLSRTWSTTPSSCRSTTLGVRTLDELAALAKAKPGTLNYTVPGIFERVFFDNFNKKHGTDLVGFHQRRRRCADWGSLRCYSDRLHRGRQSRTLRPRGKDGRSAVDATTRPPLFPDAPTLGEVGYTDPMIRSYLALEKFRAERRNQSLPSYTWTSRTSLRTRFAKRHIVDRGLEPVVDTPDIFARFLGRDRTRTAEAVKAAGVEPQSW